jgi:hypothetical protein
MPFVKQQPYQPMSDADRKSMLDSFPKPKENPQRDAAAWQNTGLPIPNYSGGHKTYERWNGQ